MDANAADLKYITADHLSTVEGALDGAPVVSRANVTLGTLAGALVDPVHRNVGYLVVDSGTWLHRHRYVLPLDLTRFDRTRGALLVDADVNDLEEFQSNNFAVFSDEDLITAMFAPRAA
jgi:hypothetical protein